MDERQVAVFDYLMKFATDLEEEDEQLVMNIIQGIVLDSTIFVDNGYLVLSTDVPAKGLRKGRLPFGEK